VGKLGLALNPWRRVRRGHAREAAHRMPCKPTSICRHSAVDDAPKTRCTTAGAPPPSSAAASAASSPCTSLQSRCCMMVRSIASCCRRRDSIIAACCWFKVAATSMQIKRSARNRFLRFGKMPCPRPPLRYCNRPMFASACSRRAIVAAASRGRGFGGARAFSAAVAERKTDKLVIFDTTLRDGEQSPGATLTEAEKVEIAKQLSRLGVDVCEAGFPIASQGDFEAVSNVAKTAGHMVEGRHNGTPMKIAGLARASKKDIERCYEAVRHAPLHRIHTFLASSDIHLEHKLGISRAKCVEIS